MITSIYKQECAAAQADADEHAEDVDSDEGASSPLAAVKSLPESIKMSTRVGGGARRFRNDASSDVLKTKEPAYLTSGLMRRRGKLIKKQRSVTAQRLPLQEAIKNGNSKILDTSKKLLLRLFVNHKCDLFQYHMGMMDPRFLKPTTGLSMLNNAVKNTKIKHFQLSLKY